MGQSSDEDRLFVKDGWRHYRRRYSLTEVRWGLATGAFLLLLFAWVAWKGTRPDPELFSDGTALLAKAPAGINISTNTVAPTAGRGTTQEAASQAGAAQEGSIGSNRGPLPKDLAGSGWKEEKVAQFDPENLYVKINGRADFFRAFGFKMLYSVLLVSDQDPATTVDVEIYDMGSASNALGAYGGERAPTTKPLTVAGGLQHTDRNALYMARATFYIRVIGSDETPVVTDKLKVLEDVLATSIQGESLPWAYDLLAGGLGLDPGMLAYTAENAFSLGYAQDVWAVRPGGKDSDLELFMIVLDDDKAAKALATRLGKSFAELGQAAGKVAGVTAIKDQFLGLFSGVSSMERWVIGVRGAESKAGLGSQIDKLKEALAKASPEVKDRAHPMPPMGGAPKGAAEGAAPAAGESAGKKADEAGEKGKADDY